ncbi:uncharacterized protein LOC128930093 [Callithrix jacchus]
MTEAELSCSFQPVPPGLHYKTRRLPAPAPPWLSIGTLAPPEPLAGLGHSPSGFPHRDPQQEANVLGRLFSLLGLEKSRARRRRVGPLQARAAPRPSRLFFLRPGPSQLFFLRPKAAHAQFCAPGLGGSSPPRSGERGCSPFPPHRLLQALFPELIPEGERRRQAERVLGGSQGKQGVNDWFLLVFPVLLGMYTVMRATSREMH